MKQPKFDPGKDSAISYALDLLTAGEGFSPTVYYDSIGKKNTAGYGFTDPKDLHNWTESDARKRLTQMATGYDKALRNGRISERYVTMTPKQQAALIDLIHQGGLGVLDSMPNFVKAVNAGDYITATKELDFGLKQTPNRAKARVAFFRPEMIYDNQESVPTAVEAMKAAPKYTYSQPVKDVISYSNAINRPNVSIPMDDLAPVYHKNGYLPDIRTLVERSIFKPTWTAQ